MQDRYTRSNLQNKLVLLGLGKEAAKALAKRIRGDEPSDDQIARNPTEFDVDRICVFKHGFTGCAWHQSICECMQGVAEVTEQKFERLKTKLGINWNWSGAMTNFDSTLAGLKDVDFGTEVMQQCASSSAPWYVAFKTASTRIGPHCWPWPGVGCVVFAVTDHVCLALCPIEPILASGIMMRDLLSHLNTPTGVQYLNKRVKMVWLQQNDVLWVPYGFIAIPTRWDPQDEQPRALKDEKPEQSAKDKQKASPELGGVAVCTIMCPQVASRLSKSLWSAISESIEKHSAATAGQNMWNDRRDVWPKFTKAVADMRSSS